MHSNHKSYRCSFLSLVCIVKTIKTGDAAVAENR